MTDLMGNRHIIRGLEGDNLAVLLAHYGDQLGGSGKSRFLEIDKAALDCKNLCKYFRLIMSCIN